MKEKIIEVLRECPDGLRLRELAMYLRCNRFALLNDINDLRREGIIVDVTVENFVQGEFYAKYYLAEKAPDVRVVHSCDLGF
jgi:hypothetical protein